MMHVVLPPGWWLASDGNYYPPDAAPGRPPLEWVEPRRVLWGTAASLVVLLIAGLVT